MLQRFLGKVSLFVSALHTVGYAPRGLHGTQNATKMLVAFTGDRIAD